MPRQMQFVFRQRDSLLGRIKRGKHEIEITREGIEKLKDSRELALLHSTFVKGNRAEDVIARNAAAWGISIKEAEGIYSRALVHLRQVTANKSLREMAMRSRKRKIMYNRVITRFGKMPLEQIAKETGYELSRVKDILRKAGKDIPVRQKQNFTLAERIARAPERKFDLKKVLSSAMRESILNLTEGIDVAKLPVGMRMLVKQTKGPMRASLAFRVSIADYVARTKKGIASREQIKQEILNKFKQKDLFLKGYTSMTPEAIEKATSEAIRELMEIGIIEKVAKARPLGYRMLENFEQK